mmetsp:Transcript_4989/g.7354  ORF Transcript_4989/g.7354 Transcript_4989/m.7354 type:complete len:498 (+) Transcript_4989:123-1616(+)
MKTKSKKTRKTDNTRKLRQRLEPIIGNEDWDGICQILQEHQHQHATATDGNRRTIAVRKEKLLKVFISNELQFELVNKKENEKAEALLLILIEWGGMDLVMEKSRKDSYARNLLQYACSKGTSIEIISKLIEIGGRELVFAKNKHNWNSLHFSCYEQNKISIDVVSKLIEVGGRDLVIEQGDWDFSPLHFACQRGSSMEVISKLVEIGGRDLVLAKNSSGGHRNALHFATANEGVSIDVLDLLIQIGGVDVLTQMDQYGKTPLTIIITQNIRLYPEAYKRAVVEKTALFIRKGIELQIEEYSIGGIFNNYRAPHHMRDIAHDHQRWSEIILPALERAIDFLNSQHQHGIRHLPILHAVIMDNAPPPIIKDVVNRFVESVNRTDSFGQLPIDVAVKRKLSWNGGMEHIIKAFLSSQEESSTVFRVCLKNGLSWENGMRAVMQRVNINDIERQDEITGLYPFMLAAVRNEEDRYKNYDLGSIFHLVMRSPTRLVRKHSS